MFSFDSIYSTTLQPFTTYLSPLYDDDDDDDEDDVVDDDDDDDDEDDAAAAAAADDDDDDYLDDNDDDNNGDDPGLAIAMKIRHKIMLLHFVPFCYILFRCYISCRFVTYRAPLFLKQLLHIVPICYI